MNMHEGRAIAVRLLEQARAIRAAFGDPGVLCEISVGPRPVAPASGEDAARNLHAALGYLWEEMVLIRDGKTATLVVLNDEIAHTEWLMARLSVANQVG